MRQSSGFNSSSVGEPLVETGLLLEYLHPRGKMRYEFNEFSNSVEMMDGIKDEHVYAHLSN